MFHTQTIKMQFDATICRFKDQGSLSESSLNGPDHSIHHTHHGDKQTIILLSYLSVNPNECI